MKRRSAFIPVIISILFVLAGCSNSTEVVKINSGLVLSADRQEGTDVTRPKGTCKIRFFRISSTFETNYLMYKVKDYSYQADYYNRFLVSPASMITEQTQKWLIESGIFRNVLDDSSRADSQYLLEGKIKSLYTDFIDADKFSAVIEINFVLIETKGVSSSIVLDKSYKAVTDLSSANIAEIINAMNLSLEKVLTSFEEDLKKI